MEGSFNHHRAQVRAFLHRFNVWNLVDGTVVRPDLSRSGKMLEDYEARHTKHVFSNYAWNMKNLFHTTYSREQRKDSWLQEIHDTCLALATLDRVIGDDLTVDVTLMWYVHTEQ
ncbi:Hypothetical protein PHPALM_36706 [Phytophthora palmivora]|uniref:Uncharacterized protein n=1 Tax=Phytophthora palmivora TaxID=4796 RepID=A0A2P4WZA6_9STRA|nr:Hypothetical protein PHPALM_36706 [Phytophthora palmivora]